MKGDQLRELKYDVERKRVELEKNSRKGRDRTKIENAERRPIENPEKKETTI